MNLLFRFALCFSLAVRWFDFSYLYAALLGVYDFMFRRGQVDLARIPANKYALKEIQADEARNPRTTDRWANLFGKFYKVHSNFYDKDFFYKVIRN